MPTLPPELYEAILDHLGGDSTALRTCALVSRLFARKCQQLLFRSITLGRPFKQFEGSIVSKNWPSKNLYQTFSSSPHLGRLIEEFEISDATLMNFYREELSWIRKDLDVARILPLLGNLQALVITGNYMGSRLNFRAWKPELKFAILRKTPSISTIYLAYIRNVPWMILKSIPSLKSLYLYQVSFVANDATVLPVSAELDADSKQAELETLHIKTTSREEWRSLYLWLQIDNGSFDLDHLTDLTLDVDFVIEEPQTSGPEEIHGIAWLLQRCSGSLRSLNLIFPQEVASPHFSSQKYLDLSSMPSLQELCLHGCVWSDRTGSQNIIPWLVRNISEVPESCQLQRLTLLFTIEDFEFLPETGFDEAVGKIWQIS
ncbi:hypothetical protein CPB84DRAFT_367498 [Gymnopilus junonius]|uniref:F-box domain-containing protein n=1 Tax=Gymnopilus junonius TaxID=109634 RepID=A0A9P5NRU9_GYMJU|nr:hypothetical protein CPB84DRAFT_367498 [Gymnopilus junonius]